jgi:lipoprotein-anchoring transpeptidase ErfK/SrfK
MRRFRLALFATVSALLLAGVLGSLVYADHREDRLAPHTTVAGVDIGGLRADPARTLLERRLGAATRRPLTLAHGDRRFVVTPAELLARFDSQGLVEEALRRGRRGNVFGRALRDLTGRDAGIDLPLRVTYAQAAVARVAARLARAVDRPARAADVDFTRRGLRLSPARSGLAVQTAALRRAIVAALEAPGARQEIEVPVRVTTRPRRTIAELRRRYPLLIGVSRPTKELRLYRHLRLVETYEIAIGQSGYKTKAGRYKIISKLKNPVWKPPDEKWVPPRLRGTLVPPGSPDNPIEARWLGFKNQLGIHGTDDIKSLGTRASHGCIRMSVPDVKELFRRVKIGTPVLIV